MKKHIRGLRGRAVKSCIIGLAIVAGLFVFVKAILWVSIYGFRTKTQVIKDARELSEVIEKYVEEQEKYREEMAGAATFQAETYTSAVGVFEENRKYVLKEIQASDSAIAEPEVLSPQSYAGKISEIINSDTSEGNAVASDDKSLDVEKRKAPRSPKEAEPEAQKPSAAESAIENGEPSEEAELKTELGQADYAKLVFDSAKYYEESGNVVFTYSQPEIPVKYHLSVEIAIFNAQGGTIDRYCSDWGWRSDVKYYDPSAKDVKVKLDVPTLKNKEVIVTVMVGNSRMDADTSVYKLIEDVNGDKEIKSANLKGGY